MSREQPALAARGLRASREAEGLPPSQERGPGLLLFLQDDVFLASLTLKTQRVGILSSDIAYVSFRMAATNPAHPQLAGRTFLRSPQGAPPQAHTMTNFT